MLPLSRILLPTLTPNKFKCVQSSGKNITDCNISYISFLHIKYPAQCVLACNNASLFDSHFFKLYIQLIE
jgi:hypothetical protein